MVLARSEPAAHGYVLHRLQVQRRALHLGQLRTEAVDELGGVDLAHFQRLERHENPSGVHGGARTTAAETQHGVDGWIGLDNLHEAGDALLHGLEGAVLVSNDGAGDAAGVFLGDKPLGDNLEQIDVQSNGNQKNGQRNRRVFQNDGQGAPIDFYDALKKSLAGLIHAAALFLSYVL